MNLQTLKINFLGLLKGKPEDTVTPKTPVETLKAQLDTIYKHPRIHRYAKNSASFQAAYTSVQAGYLTTYAKALAKTFDQSDNILLSAIEIMNKSGEIPKLEYFELKNSLTRSNGLFKPTHMH